MIDWTGIKQTLGDVLADISELGPQAVRWVDEAGGPIWDTTPTLYLRLASVSREGIEENRRTFVNTTSDLEVVVTGQRRFTLSIRVESFEQNIASTVFAGNIADRIALRLMRTSTLERLAGVCGIESRQPTKWFDYKANGRQVSVYVIDVAMRTVDNDADTFAGAGGWINEAFIDSVPGDDVIDSAISLDVKGT